MIRSALLELRIAMAHAFVYRGANGNRPADRCLVCGLLESNPVHRRDYVELQREQGDQTDRLIKTALLR